ncbi:uncharacterized protein FMAN_11770 [Fusarium mangiferae]|uniref:Uncharacterized protein n=1 Tax=Fusarium mangiferae TaxID=192010 RepID=A0A1L7U798_FUSMA|nr:uncharacterized protein FMAN_11770 [Fusarium mangiferae]CVL06610.1 uncharacterized protein FMAN_11770 [Fusarium mangiferae]
MALQTHLFRAFSDAFVIPNPTDRTPVITFKAFPTSSTSTITNHNARTTKTSTTRQRPDNDRRSPNDKRRHK